MVFSCPVFYKGSMSAIWRNTLNYLEDTKHVSQKSVDCNFIVQNLQPFSLIEQPSFESLMQELQPNCVVKYCVVKDWSSYSTYEGEGEGGNEKNWIHRHHNWLLGEDVLLGLWHIGWIPTVLACAMNEIHSEYKTLGKIVRTTTDDGSSFFKTFC